MPCKPTACIASHIHASGIGRGAIQGVTVRMAGGMHPTHSSATTGGHDASVSWRAARGLHARKDTHREAEDETKTRSFSGAARGDF